MNGDEGEALPDSPSARLIHSLRHDSDVMRLVDNIHRHVLPLQDMHDDAVARHDVSPAVAAGTALKGIGSFVAPAMTSLGTGETPAVTAWPSSGYEKVPETDPRWGAVPFEALGFLEPPAKLGGMAMAGVGAAIRQVEKHLPGYFPMGHWKQVGPQLGSNLGGTYETTAGQKWYVKFPQTEEHARNEQLTNELYRLTGANVPHTMLVQQGDKVGIASHMLPEDAIAMEHLSPDTQKLLHPKLHEHFATDAWLANRDVLGLTNDNIMLKPNFGGGDAYRIDQGGGLRFRAQGSTKPDFGPTVKEWDYMLNEGKAKAVFGSMSPEKQVESIDRVLSVPWDSVKGAMEQYGPKDPKVREALLGNLSARRVDLAKIKQGILKEPPPPVVEPEPPKAAPSPLDWKTSESPGAGKYQHAWTTDPSGLGVLHGTVGHFPETHPETPWSGIGGLEGPNKDLPFKLFKTQEEAKAYIEQGHAAAAKPEPVTYKQSGQDHFAHVGGKKVAEITDIGRDWKAGGYENRYMVEPMGVGPPSFHGTLAEAKAHVEANHPAWEPAAQEPPPIPGGKLPISKPMTEPWIAKPPAAKTDIAEAEKKGNSPDNPLQYREAKDLHYHYGSDALERAPYAEPPGEPIGSKSWPTSGVPVIHDPHEVIPAEKGALQTMMTRWLQPTEHAAARGASPFQTAAFRGVRKPPREFPTPGSDLNAYYSTSDPGLAMRYAIGEGNRPESISWMGATPTTGPRLQHLLLDTRNYLHVDAEGRNWTEIHRAAANEAARRGKHGVVINRTHDEPSAQPKAGQAPVTVFLTFRPGMHTVRSAAARFDPTHFGKVGLKYGVAGALPAGMATAYSHGPAPEEYHEPNALGAR